MVLQSVKLLAISISPREIGKNPTLGVHSSVEFGADPIVRCDRERVDGSCGCLVPSAHRMRCVNMRILRTFDRHEDESYLFFSFVERKWPTLTWLWPSHVARGIGSKFVLECKGSSLICPNFVFIFFSAVDNCDTPRPFRASWKKRPRHLPVSNFGDHATFDADAISHQQGYTCQAHPLFWGISALRGRVEGGSPHGIPIGRPTVWLQ